MKCFCSNNTKFFCCSDSCKTYNYIVYFAFGKKKKLLAISTIIFFLFLFVLQGYGTSNNISLFSKYKWNKLRKFHTVSTVIDALRKDRFYKKFPILWRHGGRGSRDKNSDYLKAFEKYNNNVQLYSFYAFSVLLKWIYWSKLCLNCDISPIEFSIGSGNPFYPIPGLPQIVFVASLVSSDRLQVWIWHWLSSLDSADY